MWQVLLAALVIGSLGGSRAPQASPVMAFAALKEDRSRRPWWVASSLGLHLLLLLVLAFAVELVRDSNRQLRRDALVIPASFTPVRISALEKNYYPTGQLRATNSPQAHSIHRRPKLIFPLISPTALPSVETGAAIFAPDLLPFTLPAALLPDTDSSGQSGAVRTVETRAGKLNIQEFADGSREIRYPEDGRFDAVIVQSGGDELVPEAAQFLSGRPVQMVYLPVGTGRELILQYCLPARAQASIIQSGMVVWLSSASKLRPPWIRTATLPQPSATSSRSSVFYATLETSGKLHNIHALTGSQYQSRPDLLASLDGWIFRPAEQDGAPIEIEILLIVPADVAL